MTTTTTPILLSGFADEAANEKQAVQQYSAFAALGLKYYSIRFIDAGQGIKNVMLLSDSEIEHLVKMQSDYGLRVSSIGSRISAANSLPSSAPAGTPMSTTSSSPTCSIPGWVTRPSFG